MFNYLLSHTHIYTFTKSQTQNYIVVRNMTDHTLFIEREHTVHIRTTKIWSIIHLLRKKRWRSLYEAYNFVESAVTFYSTCIVDSPLKVTSDKVLIRVVPIWIMILLNLGAGVWAGSFQFSSTHAVPPALD